MKIIFLTLIDINNINERGIYHDLLREFRNNGHEVYIISPNERRKGEPTKIIKENGIHLLKVKTLNIQKTNALEKGIGTLLLKNQFLSAFKKYFKHIKFDLVLYSTPPITLTKIINYIKKRDNALSYLLLKDIFPQNAIDLNMIKKGGILHRFFRSKEKKLYKISDYIGCMSPANVDFILTHNPEVLPEKVEVNPNSISPINLEISISEIKAIRQKYKIPLDPIIYIYGGNIGKPQGIDFLLEILEDNLSNKNVYFVIVGSGTEYPKIKKWFNKVNRKNACLISSLSKQDYDELLKACDVGLIFLDKRFTIPNFPSRLLSYLENKMPVLAATDTSTDIGLIIENAQAGAWVESGNIEKFRQKLETFSDRDLLKEMGENGKKLLMKEYTVNSSYQIILNKIKRNN